MVCQLYHVQGRMSEESYERKTMGIGGLHFGSDSGGRWSARSAELRSQQGYYWRTARSSTAWGGRLGRVLILTPFMIFPVLPPEWLHKSETPQSLHPITWTYCTITQLWLQHQPWHNPWVKWQRSSSAIKPYHVSHRYVLMNEIIIIIFWDKQLLYVLFFCKTSVQVAGSSTFWASGIGLIPVKYQVQK